MVLGIPFSQLQVALQRKAHLVGRWKSDAMFRYLHAQALPLIRDLAATMLTHGNFTLLAGSDVPPHVAPMLADL